MATAASGEPVFNIHDKISLQEGVQVVIDRVCEGMRMAGAAGLPSNIVDIIPRYYGTKTSKFLL